VGVGKALDLVDCAVEIREARAALLPAARLVFARGSSLIEAVGKGLWLAGETDTSLGEGFETDTEVPKIASPRRLRTPLRSLY
jgi:hypothetical protein